MPGFRVAPITIRTVITLVGSTQMVSMVRRKPRWPSRLALNQINQSVLLDLVRPFLYLHLSAVAGLDFESWELINSPNVNVLRGRVLSHAPRRAG
jgi:hypothetical protein